MGKFFFEWFGGDFCFFFGRNDSMIACFELAFIHNDVPCTSEGVMRHHIC